MCGIAAWLGEDAAAGQAFARRANRLMAHRGPDGEDIFLATGVALAHRRLAILDLSDRGRQPMVSPDGRYALTYNGEIYNHRALRPALARAGWRFRSESDTETLLAVLALEGPEGLRRLVGMWALALWDTRTRRLLVSRDRYGQKPLYWRRLAGGALVFSSEVAPLLADGERPAADAGALAEFLATGAWGHLAERTFFRDVLSFPAGCSAWIDPAEAQVRPERYWRFPAPSRQDRRPFDTAAQTAFRDAFVEAVISQTAADTPLAATLSGGIDSSAVVGVLAARGERAPLKVFTAQAQGAARDESRYVAAVKAKWGDRLDIETFPSQHMVLSERLDDVIDAQAGPFGDPSIMAHDALAAAAARAGAKVLLGGQGADELLLGYPYMSSSVVASALREGDAVWALGQLPRLGRGPAHALRVLGSAISPELERTLREQSRRRLFHWLSPHLRGGGHGPRLSPLSARAAFWRESVEVLALPHLVRYDDHNGMRHSLEGRMPFLDHRLAEVATGIEPRAFFLEGRRKALLRQSCTEFLPRAVIDRTDKIGFHTPLADLLNAELDWVRAQTLGERARDMKLYDTAFMEGQIERLAAGQSQGSADLVWRALAAQAFLRRFDIDPASLAVDRDAAA